MCNGPLPGQHAPTNAKTYLTQTQQALTSDLSAANTALPHSTEDGVDGILPDAVDGPQPSHLSPETGLIPIVEEVVIFPLAHTPSSVSYTHLTLPTTPYV